jgi:uncharacterized protein YlxW (UPF0749 family)
VAGHLLAAADPVLLAAIPVIGVVAAALIAGIFGQANRRSTEADQARRELVEDQREHIAMLKSQVEALEAKVRRYEDRPTRGKP